MNFCIIPHPNKEALAQSTFPSYHLQQQYRLFTDGNLHEQRKLDEGCTIHVIGDCLNPELITEISLRDPDNLLKKLRGNFYLIVDHPDGVLLANSLFGMLPIYFDTNRRYFTSSIDFVSRFTAPTEPLAEDKAFWVNQLLFNYQPGNRTPLSNFKTLPAFSYVQLSASNYQSHTYLHVADLFSDKPKTWQNSVGALANLFIDRATSYMPNGSVVSFTGGFDGRCLVSAGLHKGLNFSTFSYGRQENDDVYLPQRHAGELNLEHGWLDLGNTAYTDSDYATSSLRYLQSTNAQNGLLYAHVDHSAQVVAAKSAYLISGMCGSELLRATHSAGAVYAQTLLDLFTSENRQEFDQSVRNSEALKYLDQEVFTAAVEEVIEESWAMRQAFSPNLSKSKMLYVFTCHEVFRKFFGPWLSAQMQHLKPRTPYLDFELFDALQKTELSGAYSDFLTKNPLKRFKGQMLYAEIIRQSSQVIYRQKTGKGYSPRSLREWYLRPSIAAPFVVKRFKRKTVNTNLDNLGIISGISKNGPSLLQNFKTDHLNLDSLKQNLLNISPDIRERDRDILLQTLSYIQYLKLNQ